MALRTQVPNEVDLNWKNSHPYILPNEDPFLVPSPDLSQIGLKRNQFAPEWRFPCLRDLQVRVPINSIPFLAGKTFLTTYVPVLVEEPPEEIQLVEQEQQAEVPLAPKVRRTTEAVDWQIVPMQSVLLTVDTTNIMFANLTPDQVGSFQKALAPIAAPTPEEIAKHPAVANEIERLKEDVDIFCESIHAWLMDKLAADPQLADKLAVLGFGDKDNATIGGLEINPDDIKDMTRPVIMLLSTRLSDAPEQVKKAFLVLDFLNLIERHGLTETTLNHEIMTARYTTAFNDLAIREIQPTNELNDLVGARNDNNIPGVMVRLSVQCKRDLSDREEQISLIEYNNPRATSWLNNFGVFAANYFIPEDPDVEACADFAFARTIVARHGLMRDSDERIEAVPRREIAYGLPEQAVLAFIERLNKPETAYVQLWVSCISFLKAGHHATMVGIRETASKIYNAISHQQGNNSIDRMIKCGLYWGTHVASTRMALYLMLTRAKTEKYTKAIAYRMTPVPPTYAAVCNLEIFIDSLDAAGFFAFTNNEIKYSGFKANMRAIRSVMHFAAPYSYYLFGEQKEEPIQQRAQALEFAAYAAAIRDVLPNSTLLGSPSLMKAANAANVNSIEAQLLVSSYVAAYRRFFRGQIQQKMAGRNVPLLDPP